ncbi:hypothetical protein Dsin_026984 [Dipteronia sinensis]|uniref:Uncharacterized protein n=1 Tax=Dipteronia sinensis TaxID=43782 RepID=A0AAD9ZZR9_9ROSI|nr:hypothetical protein Dsin_026984 [Dipteronia sinensis]
MGKSGLPIMTRMIFAVMMVIFAEAADTNPVYSPCLDAKVSKWDGFTFGLAFSTKESFFMNQTQLSPCDIRLPLAGSNARLAVFRPKVDEMTLISLENTTFTPVIEFQHGTLQNLFWKSFGCDSCSGDSICLNNQDCAVPNSKCKSNGGPVDCTLAIQLTFSGTDKNLEALNSWFELKNFQKHSLYGLYSGVIDSLPNLPN